MLPKKYRLKFVEFYQNPHKAKKFTTPVLDFFLKFSTNILPRFVVVVPKSLDKHSSKRHKTRRVIVEVIRKNLTKFKKTGDVLIKAKKIFKKEDLPLFEKAIYSVFRTSSSRSNVVQSKDRF